MTGKAGRVDLWPTRLDFILRQSSFDRRAAIGWLISQLAEAAVRIAPDYVPKDPVPLQRVFTERRKAQRPERPWQPRWRRRMTDIDYDDDEEIT